MSQPVETSIDVARGVTLAGVYHPPTRGNRTTPGESGYVDADTLRLDGRPDRVAQWLSDEGVDPSDWNDWRRHQYLEGLADDLRERVESLRCEKEAA